MARGFIDRLRSEGMSTGMLKGIVLVNIAVFVALRVTAIIAGFCGYGPGFANRMLRMVEMPGDVSMLIHRPWTVLTYMFSQYESSHIIFNMLWLYWFGEVFARICADGRRMLQLYVCGGLGGAVFYISACATLPHSLGLNGWLIGSSASVIAVVVATAVLAPDYRMNIWSFGTVPLKYVAMVTIGIDLLSLTAANAGGHFAHLGGAVVGVIFALLKKHRDMSRCQKLPTSVPEVRAELDAILDKIRRSGYTSLTGEERKRLYDLSRIK